jgi:tetratricopeptide (TPR) repeat protein
VPVQAIAPVGRDAEALASRDAAIGKEPADPDYLERRATVHERLGDPEAALEDLKRAITLDADNLELRMRRARLLHVSLKRADLALRDLDWAIEHDPEQARLYWVRAHLRRELGQEPDAERDLEELRRRDPALYRELVAGEA